jgi:cytochrome c-type biogenesis protein CcmH
MAPLAGLAGIVLAGVLVVAVWGPQSGAPSLNDRVRAVATELRCPVCQGESVWDSPAGLAGDMRATIRRRLEAGQSSAQIRRYFVTRYGSWILLAPPASGIGAVVWLGPPFMLVAGLLVLGLLVATWRRNRQPTASRMPEQADDIAWEMERLEDRLAEGQIEPEQYKNERLALERAASPAARQSGADPRRTWLQVGVMASAALIIAASVSLAVHARGSSAITGSAPGSATPTASPVDAVPADVRAAMAAVARHRRAGWAWARLGSALALHRQYSAARLAFKRAIIYAPVLRDARLGLAFLDIRQARDGDAVHVLAPVVKDDPKSPRLWLLEGLARARIAGQAGRAAADFRRYLRLAPSSLLLPSVRHWLNDLNQGLPAP